MHHLHEAQGHLSWPSREGVHYVRTEAWYLLPQPPVSYPIPSVVVQYSHPLVTPIPTLLPQRRCLHPLPPPPMSVSKRNRSPPQIKLQNIGTMKSLTFWTMEPVTFKRKSGARSPLHRHARRFLLLKSAKPVSPPALPNCLRRFTSNP